MSWYELGKVAGVEVVEDADVEEELMTEEDREVEKVMTTNRQKHDKLLKGTVDCYVQYSTLISCREC